MPAGGWYIDPREVREFEKAIKATGAGLRDMRPAYAHLADEVRRSVQLRTTVGSASSKDGAGHLPPGSLRASIRGKSTAQNAFVFSEWKGPLILQEFGGTSVWKRGTGAQFARTRKGNRSTGAFTTNYKSNRVRTHKVYKKARKPRGYFIWNAWWYLRDEVFDTLVGYIQTTASRHGISVEIGTPAGEGSMTGDSFNRAA